MKSKYSPPPQPDDEPVDDESEHRPRSARPSRRSSRHSESESVSDARTRQTPTSGTITALEIQTRNKQRVNLFLDEVYAFSLTVDEAIQLRKGQHLTEAEAAALQGEDAVQKAVEAGVNYLSYRARSIKEVRDKLEEKATPEAAERAIERLGALGYLDDLVFATLWVRDRMQFRPASPRALGYELRQKGIDGDTIAEVLAAVDVEEMAYRAVQAQGRRVRGLPARDARAKLTAFLARRGFSYGDSRRAIDRLFETWALDTSDDEEQALDGADDLNPDEME